MEKKKQRLNQFATSLKRKKSFKVLFPSLCLLMVYFKLFLLNYHWEKFGCYIFFFKNCWNSFSLLKRNVWMFIFINKFISIRLNNKILMTCSILTQDWNGVNINIHSTNLWMEPLNFGHNKLYEIIWVMVTSLSLKIVNGVTFYKS